jgi:hypothetical protein
MKSYLAAILALTSLLGFAISASAQDEAVVSVPFEFVAGGAMLSAGRYRISRIDPAVHRGLVLSNDKQEAYVLPLAFDEKVSGQPELGFEDVGGRYFLSKVETLGRRLYLRDTTRAGEGRTGEGSRCPVLLWGLIRSTAVRLNEPAFGERGHLFRTQGSRHLCVYL